MNDFNHDGKIDGRDYAMYEEFIESEKMVISIAQVHLVAISLGAMERLGF